jgi:uronate dehydrogenase
VGRKTQRVLVTGAGGLVGQVLLRELGETFDMAGVDTRRHVRGITRADMTRQRQAERVLDGVDVVIDLASSHWQQPWNLVLNNNIPAAWTTLEAARRQGVRRIVYASSNHVTGLYERDEPFASVLAGQYEGLDPDTMPKISTTMPVRPDTPYGVGKVLGEAAARYYAEEHGMSVLCLRIGSLNRVGRPTTARHFATLITHGDMAALTRCCIEAPPDLSFGVYYGVSANTWRIWDLSNATRALGYEPQDDAERWRESVDSHANLRTWRH